MKYISIAAALLLAVVLGTSAVTVQGQLTGEVNSVGRPIYDYAPDKPTSPQLVDSAIPRVYVVFWDGRDGDADNVIGQVQSFLRRGLPVALGLVTDSVGTSGFLTWDEIRGLQRFAYSKGTSLHFIQHTNSNLSDTPASLTHEDIVNDFETSAFLDEVGYRVRVAGIPGGDARFNWHRRNIHYVADTLDSLGIWYTIGSARRDSTQSVSHIAAQYNFNDQVGTRSNYLDDTILRGGRPGQNIWRHDLPLPSGDLGQLVVERTAYTGPYEPYEATSGDTFTSYGQERFTGIEPPRAAEWTLTGNGATANAGGVWNRTWAWFYSRSLALNYGFGVATHDSAEASDLATPPTGISDAEYAAGAWSPEHIAWTLAMLQAKGHIKVVGVEEWAEWITGEWAPGTDLIDNPYCEIPQFAIGDTLLATSEYPWIRGLSDQGAALSGQSAINFPIRQFSIEQTGGVAKWDRGGVDPHVAAGKMVTGVRGRAGGISMNGTNPNIIRLTKGGLPPGKYSFSMDINAANTVNIFDFQTANLIRGFKLNASAETGFAPAYSDSLMLWKWTDDGIGPLNTNYVNRWYNFYIPLHFPTTLVGENVAGALFGGSTEDSGAGTWAPVANGGTEFMPMMSSSSWAYSITLNPAGNLTISSPRLIYLGE